VLTALKEIYFAAKYRKKVRFVVRFMKENGNAGTVGIVKRCQLFSKICWVLNQTIIIFFFS
jgi:hypothetical protein